MHIFIVFLIICVIISIIMLPTYDDLGGCAYIFAVLNFAMVVFVIIGNTNHYDEITKNTKPIYPIYSITKLIDNKDTSNFVIGLDSKQNIVTCVLNDSYSDIYTVTRKKYNRIIIDSVNSPYVFTSVTREKESWFLYLVFGNFLSNTHYYSEIHVPKNYIIKPITF